MLVGEPPQTRRFRDSSTQLPLFASGHFVPKLTLFRCALLPTQPAALGAGPYEPKALSAEPALSGLFLIFRPR